MASSMGRGSSTPKAPARATKDLFPPAADDDGEPMSAETRARRPASHRHRDRAVLKARAKRGSSLRPSRSKAAVGLRLEFKQGAHPGLSERRLRKWYELRLSRAQAGTRWKKWASLKGADLVRKVEAGEWWPALLPEFRTEKSHRAQTFLGYCNLAMRVLGKPGLCISIPLIMRLLGCGHGTATRLLAKLITGEEDGKIMEALRGEGGPQHWLVPRYDLPPSRTKDPRTGQKLDSWQLCNWYEAGPLLRAAWQAAKDRQEKKAAKKAAAPVAPPPSDPAKDGMPSPKGDLISNSQEHAEPAIVGSGPPLAAGDKVSPAATSETEPTPISGRAAGCAGKIADQDKTSAPRRTLSANSMPPRPIAAALLDEIRAAVAAGADEQDLMRHADKDPEFALTLACIVTKRPRPTLPRYSPAAAEGAARDPRWHERRSDAHRLRPTNKGTP